MSKDGSDWVGRQLAGRYTVTARLGAGGMGLVLRAKDHNLQTDVVVKVPHKKMLADEEFVKRFAQEVRSLVTLSHPHVVAVLDVGEDSGVPFSVMRFLPGGDLKGRQPRSADRKPLPQDPRTLSGWLGEVAKALDFIHSQGYVHRDIKPENILFDAAGNAYVGDFGIIKAMGTEFDKATKNLTQQGVALGTPEYMAPEVVMGEQYDGRADQYALAVTVYEVLCGRPPFRGNTPAAIIVKSTTQKAVSPSDVIDGIPQEVSARILKGLARRPEDRYNSCSTFATEILEAVQNHVSNAATARTGVKTGVGSGVDGPTTFPTGPGTEELLATPPALPVRDKRKDEVECPGCGNRFPHDAANKSAPRCPKCGHRFAAPGTSGKTIVEAPPLPERDTSGRLSDTDMQPRAGRSETAPPPVPPPQKKKQKQKENKQKSKRSKSAGRQTAPAAPADPDQSPKKPTDDKPAAQSPSSADVKTELQDSPGKKPAEASGASAASREVRPSDRTTIHDAQSVLAASADDEKRTEVHSSSEIEQQETAAEGQPKEQSPAGQATEPITGKSAPVIDQARAETDEPPTVMPVEEKSKSKPDETKSAGSAAGKTQPEPASTAAKQPESKAEPGKPPLPTPGFRSKPKRVRPVKARPVNTESKNSDDNVPAVPAPVGSKPPLPAPQPKPQRPKRERKPQPQRPAAGDRSSGGSPAKLIFKILLALLLIGLMSAPVIWLLRNRNIIVAADGSGNYDSLAKAVEEAPPGATIRIRKGRYFEDRITIDKPLTIEGVADRSKVRIHIKDTLIISHAGVKLKGVSIIGKSRGSASEKPKYAPRPTKSMILLMPAQIGSSSGKSRDLQLLSQGAEKAERAAIRITTGTPHLEDCIISSEDGSGIVVEGKGTRPTIRLCNIRDCQAAGVYFDNEASGRVEKCDIERCGKDGVYITGGEPSVINCRIFGKQDYGVRATAGTVLVEGGEIRDSKICGIYSMEKADLTVQNCKVTDGEKYGIWVSGKGQLIDAHIRANKEHGVVISKTGNVQIRECECNSNEKIGMAVYGVGKIEDCTVTLNGTDGIYVQDLGDVIVSGKFTRIEENKAHGVRAFGKITIGDCSISKNKDTGVAVYGGTGYLKRCRISNNTKTGFVSGRQLFTGSKTEDSYVTVEDCIVSGNRTSYVKHTASSIRWVGANTIDGRRISPKTE